MVKIVYNACYGGFGLSKEAKEMYAELKGIRLYFKDNHCYTDLSCDDKYYYYPKYSRHDPDLVKVVETLGEKANGMCAELEIYEIGSNSYRIDEYDGWESVMEPDSYDWIIVGVNN